MSGKQNTDTKDQFTDNEEVKETNKKNSILSFSKSKKILLIIFALIISIVVVILIISNNSISSNEANIPYKDSLKLSVSKNTIPINTETSTKTITEKKELEISAIKSELQELRNINQTSHGRASELLAQNKELKKQINNLIKLMSEKGKQNKQWFDRQLEAKVSMLKQQITSLEADYKNLYLELKKLQEEKLKTISYNNKKQKPPFKVLAIDLWNNKPQVTIAVSNKVTIADIGDYVLGWKIEKINFSKQHIKIIKNAKSLILSRHTHNIDAHKYLLNKAKANNSKPQIKLTGEK